MARPFSASISAALTPSILLSGPIMLFAFMSGAFDGVTILTFGMGIFTVSWVFILVVGLPVFALARRVITFSYGRAFMLGMGLGLGALSLSLLLPPEEDKARPTAGLPQIAAVTFAGLYGGIGGLAFWSTWSRHKTAGLTK